MAELFESYKINNPPPQRLALRLLGLPLPLRLTPRGLKVLRLTLASALLHGLFFAALIYVPILREMFHLTNKFSSAEFVDEDYEKTRIQDRVVAMLDVSNFQYPPGYFNEQPTTAQAPAIEQPTPTPAPRIVPTPSPSPEPTPTPTPDQPKTKEDAEKALDEMEAKSGVARPNEDKINKKPWKDWLATWNGRYKDGKLDLSKTIEVVIVAQRDDKGKLHDPQVVNKAGDPILIEAAKDLVSAINDSNILYFLEGSGQLRFIIRLDATQVTARVESETESEARAMKMAATYGLMLYLGEKARSGKDEAVIYQNTQISAEGKQVVVDFSMPRQAAGDMLKKQLPAS